MSCTSAPRSKWATSSSVSDLVASSPTSEHFYSGLLSILTPAVTAPTGSGGAVVICFVSFVGSPNSLVMPDPSEVSALSRRGCRTPYPPDYRTAFAFSDLPHPHRPGSALRPSYPRTRERYGLPGAPY